MVSVINSKFKTIKHLPEIYVSKLKWAEQRDWYRVIKWGD